MIFSRQKKGYGGKCKGTQRTMQGASGSSNIIKEEPTKKKEGEIFDPVEKEILVEKKVKVHENRKTAQRSWRKMGRQIRGHIKPNTLK
jgi:hypothetical protein